MLAARAAESPALVRGLVQRPRGSRSEASSSSASLLRRLATLSPAEREQVSFAMVRNTAATVLGMRRESWKRIGRCTSWAWTR